MITTSGSASVVAGDASRPVRALFTASTVAVVGASDHPAKWGHGISRSALTSRFDEVFLINPSRPTVADRATVPSLRDLSTAPELVVITIPAARFEAAVDDALAVGARAIVGITAGFGEHDEAGRAAQERVVARVRAADAVLLGPNCAGLGNTAAGLDLFWGGGFPAGPVAVLSQSGNVTADVGRRLGWVDSGVSQYASVGNQADLSVADLLPVVAGFDSTTVVAMYVEEFRDGRGLVDGIADAVAAGRRVVVLPAGRSGAGARSAASHTGSMVSDARVVRAACEEAGADVVESLEDLVDLCVALAGPGRTAGRRFAVFGDGGGHCTIAADALVDAGGEVPALSPVLADQVAAVLDPISSSSNPIDTAGATDRTPFVWSDVAALLQQSGEIDGLLITGGFGIYTELGMPTADDELETARRLGRIASERAWPIVVHSYNPHSDAVRQLRRAGIAAYDRLTSAIAGLSALARSQPRPVRRRRDRTAIETVAGSIEPLDYWRARTEVEAVGVSMVPGALVHDRAQAVAAAGRLGFPVVAKVITTIHKSDIGGVRLGLHDTAAVADAYEALALVGGSPAIAIERQVVVDDAIELVMAVRRDRSFGPVLTVGAGGVEAEVWRDIAVGLAPVDVTGARELLERLRIAPLLLGHRGASPVDLDALCELIATVSGVMDLRPDIVEVELNPVLASPHRTVALDAVIFAVVPERAAERTATVALSVDS